MLASKNRLMFILSLFMIFLSIAVHLLHRVFDIFGHSMNGHGAMSSGGGAEQFTLIVNILLIVPVALLAAGLVLYGKRKEHPWIPMLNTMALTFSSISMIAGGGGMVELHFSIFMVVAMLSYYEQIKLVVAMSSVFALQHAIGFFVLPEVVFGVSEYSLLMMSIHALFLVLTSTAVVRQIASKRDITAALEKEKAIKQGEIDRLLDTVKELSGELDSASVVVADQSASNIASGDEMLLAFKEVAFGLEAQSESVNGIEMNLQSMNGMIRNSVHSFKELNEKAAGAEQLVRSNQNYVEPLFEQISIVSEAIQRSSQAMQSLDHSTRHVESIISTIQEVASQTQLLALNASIEAAHAGHHGTGFAVVASEIRKLADRSNVAIGQISQILTGIQSESAASAAQIELGKEAAAYTVELAHTTVDSYRLMNEGIKEMVDIAASLSDAVEELDRRAKEISIEMMNITAVTEQGVASVEEMYSTTEAQLNATHHINGEITKLKELANTLSRQFMQS